MGSLVLVSLPTTHSYTIDMSIDWEEVNTKLPYARTKDDFAARKELWDGMDVNGNGYLSLAEVTKGIRDVIAVDELFDAIPAINRSFHHCKNVATNQGEHGDDYIEFREFRLLLQTLRQFFEYYQAFDRVDTGDDDRISKEEFTSDALKCAMEKWVGPIEDMEGEFDSIDTNGGGQILFNEFIDWALARDLDIEDDVEPED